MYEAKNAKQRIDARKAKLLDTAVTNQLERLDDHAVCEIRRAYYKATEGLRALADALERGDMIDQHLMVCSALEASRVRTAFGPKPLIVTPGIRRPGDLVGDQARAAGPAEAVRAGATHLVVRRPILAAPDPAATVNQFLEAIS